MVTTDAHNNSPSDPERFAFSSVDVIVLDEAKDNASKCACPEGGNGHTLLIDECSKNSNGVVASTIVPKSESLSLKSKNIIHAIQGNLFFSKKRMLKSYSIVKKKPKFYFNYSRCVNHAQ